MSPCFAQVIKSSLCCYNKHNSFEFGESFVATSPISEIIFTSDMKIVELSLVVIAQKFMLILSFTLEINH